MKPEYKEGVKIREEFERTTTELFRAPNPTERGWPTHRLLVFLHSSPRKWQPFSWWRVKTPAACGALTTHHYPFFFRLGHKPVKVVFMNEIRLPGGG